MRWKYINDDAASARLAEEASLPPLIARLLWQREIRDAAGVERFLHPALEHLHDPFVMRGMAAAIERLEAAIARREKILIYGDYDVDGTVAVVILKTCIELLGGTADFHVPHRILEGYGMRDEVIERAAAEGVTLVISVDTGIRAFAAAETASRLNLDLIVTDHHLPEAASGVPRALAVLNPNQPGCDYPCKGLCGAGVAFKIAQALLTRAGRERLIPSFLKMAAIATVADSVPLCGENRAIVRLGLEGLRRPVNGGLRALLQVAQLLESERGARRLTATDIGFRIGPRINAAGRMDVARDVVELFTTPDPERQLAIARRLDALNAERQAEEKRILAEIHRRLDEDTALSATYLPVVAGEGWHRGVIGITATRVVERCGKPALVVSIEGEVAHGSGRSIAGFHLLDAIESEECRPLFTRFGGHAHAVGFAMPAVNLPALQAALDAYARTRLTPEDFFPQLEVDAVVSLAEVTPQFLHALRALEPFGVGNREPVFAAQAKLVQPVRIMKEKHIKLRVMHQQQAFDAVAWNCAERILPMQLVIGESLEIAFTVEENSNPDFAGLQLHMKDVRRATAAAAD